MLLLLLLLLLLPPPSSKGVVVVGLLFEWKGGVSRGTPEATDDEERGPCSLLKVRWVVLVVVCSVGGGGGGLGVSGRPCWCIMTALDPPAVRIRVWAIERLSAVAGVSSLALLLPMSGR
jgi:hypothetical protein